MCCGLPSVNRIIATGLDNGRRRRFVTSSYRYRPVGNISRLTDDTKACYHRCSRELRLSYTKLRIRCVSTRRASDQTETERGCGYLSIVNKIYTTEYHCSKQRSQQSARRRRCKVTVEQCQFHVHGFKIMSLRWFRYNNVTYSNIGLATAYHRAQNRQARASA